MIPLRKEGEDASEPTPRREEVSEERAPGGSTSDDRAGLERLHVGPIDWAPGEELWTLAVPASAWTRTVGFILGDLGHPLSDLFGEDVRTVRGTLDVHAVFLGRGAGRGVHLRCGLLPERPVLPTLAELVPYAGPFEREVAEMFGVTFDGAVDTRPLLLHEKHGVPPMLHGPPVAPNGERSPYLFPTVEGEGVYEVSVGPVHAGIIEPGHFRFQVIGERILNLETRFGYAHKGTERLFQGLPFERGTILAESVSGDMSVAGGVAFAQAVERALQLPVPSSVELDRALLLEIERVGFLCGDVAGIALDTGYGVGAAQANVMRDSAYRALQGLTGSRLGRAIVGVGRLRRPLGEVPRPELVERMERISAGIRSLHDSLLDKSSVVDRLEGTGVIPRWVAELMQFRGPTARASGLRIDVRHDRPYGAYRDEEVRVPRGLHGDVQARLAVKVQEIVEGCRLAEQFLHRVGATGRLAGQAPGRPPMRSSGLGAVESPRGELLIHVTIGEAGLLERVRVRDPSFLTWPAIEFAVRGNILPDFPLCNKSLNLSYSGYDR